MVRAERLQKKDINEMHVSVSAASQHSPELFHYFVSGGKQLSPVPRPHCKQNLPVGPNKGT